jgi:N-acetylmuramoyl-L-alanine amidase
MAAPKTDLGSVLLVFVVLSVVLESAMSTLFNWRWFLARFDEKGFKTPFLIAVALVLLTLYPTLDLLHRLLVALGEASEGPTWFGRILTALVLGGGNDAVYRLWTRLGLRDPAAREQKAREAKAALRAEQARRAAAARPVPGVPRLEAASTAPAFAPGALAGTVVLDPGHGGTAAIGGSSPNNAIAIPSGRLEKDMTLELVELVERALRRDAPDVKVVLTRQGDENLGLADRARCARNNGADRFLSIHFNASEGHVARGVETHVRRSSENVNFAEDVAFARRVNDSVFVALRRRDAGTRDRGIKESGLGVLSDAELGNTAGSHRCRACLLEVEFIDVPAVDALLNTGVDAPQVRQEIAEAIVAAILADLAA